MCCCMNASIVWLHNRLYIDCVCVHLVFSVPQASINITQSMEGSVSGLNHTLTCTAAVADGVSSSQVMIDWSLGDSLSEPPRGNISNQTNNGIQYTRTVTFSPLLSIDGGEYICSVSVDGFSGANNSDSVTVMVNGRCTYCTCITLLLC